MRTPHGGGTQADSRHQLAGEEADLGADDPQSEIGALKQVFNWAIDQGLLEHNPLRRLKKPTAQRRERLLTAAERDKIFAVTTEETFCQFLLALQETGARPGEIRQVTAENVNLAHGVWVLSKHKTAKKTKRPRVIYLTPTMVELTIALYFVLFRKDLNQRLRELWSRLPTWCRKLT